MSEFKEDMQDVIAIERRLAKLTDRYRSLERSLEEAEKRGDDTSSLHRRMARAERRQDAIDAELHNILKWYEVTFKDTYYIVTDPAGGEYFRFEKKGF